MTNRSISRLLWSRHERFKAFISIRDNGDIYIYFHQQRSSSRWPKSEVLYRSLHKPQSYLDYGQEDMSTYGLNRNESEEDDEFISSGFNKLNEVYFSSSGKKYNFLIHMGYTSLKRSIQTRYYTTFNTFDSTRRWSSRTVGKLPWITLNRRLNSRQKRIIFWYPQTN